MKLTFRPLSNYPVPETKLRERSRFIRPGRERYSLFEVMRELEAELGRTGVRVDALVEVDLAENQIRNDGWPYSTSKMASPRVVLSFTHPQQGSLRFPCDTYTRAEDNIRAITLALEALRAIDRYGVVRRAEQYTGWKALPAESGAGLNLTAVLALVVATDPQTAGRDSKDSQSIAATYVKLEPEVRAAFRRALVASHPDRGGNEEVFKSLNNARTTLSAHFGGNW